MDEETLAQILNATSDATTDATTDTTTTTEAAQPEPVVAGPVETSDTNAIIDEVLELLKP